MVSMVLLVLDVLGDDSACFRRTNVMFVKFFVPLPSVRGRTPGRSFCTKPVQKDLGSENSERHEVWPCNGRCAESSEGTAVAVPHPIGSPSYIKIS